MTGPVAGAAAATVAAGTARISAAWGEGSVEPEALRHRSEGVADLAARRALVSEVLVPEPMATALSQEADDDFRTVINQPREVVYDGANAYIRVAGRWTGFFLGDPAGPRGTNDPLWPLDAFFGAGDDATQIGLDDVRGTETTHYRLTVDLSRADTALPAGITVPSGPYRGLFVMPAEVWLDAAGRALRIAVSADPAAGANPQYWAVVELWDFGLPVDITPPRPDEVAKPSEVDWDPGAPRS